MLKYGVLFQSKVVMNRKIKTLCIFICNWFVDDNSYSCMQMKMYYTIQYIFFIRRESFCIEVWHYYQPFVHFL